MPLVALGSPTFRDGSPPPLASSIRTDDQRAAPGNVTTPGAGVQQISQGPTTLTTTKQMLGPVASAARERLATMITAREELFASIDRASAALTRLASAQTADVPIVGELAALDAVETAKMNEWARSGRR